MDLLRWMGLTFARFVAMVVGIVGVRSLAGNTVDSSFSGWVLAWIIFSGAAGVLGGIAYLISFDGPRRFRTRKIRLGGWLAMVGGSLLPTSLTLMILPMLMVVCPLLPYLSITPAEDSV